MAAMPRPAAGRPGCSTPPSTPSPSVCLSALLTKESLITVTILQQWWSLCCTAKPGALQCSYSAYVHLRLPRGSKPGTAWRCGRKLYSQCSCALKHACVTVSAAKLCRAGESFGRCKPSRLQTPQPKRANPATQSQRCHTARMRVPTCIGIAKKVRHVAAASVLLLRSC